MRANNRMKRAALVAVYVVATIQFVWCYFSITHPWVNTERYSLGRERMPFQGRMLMELPLRWAEQSHWLAWASRVRKRVAAGCGGCGVPVAGGLADDKALLG
jgi:hypothetical protein